MLKTVNDGGVSKARPLTGLIGYALIPWSSATGRTSIMVEYIDALRVLVGVYSTGERSFRTINTNDPSPDDPQRIV